MRVCFYIHSSHRGRQVLNSETIQSPQEKFNSSYMLGSEIGEIMDVTPAAITRAIRRGDLPQPIYLNCNFYLWERETVMPFIQRWKEKSRK